MMSLPPLWFACDHAGYDLQKDLVLWAKSQGFSVHIPNDQASSEPVDYPCVVPAVARAVSQSKGYGVLICGSGVGMAIAANRFLGVRALVGHSADLVSLARSHNDANLVALGARYMDLSTAQQCIHALCHTPFQGGRHAGRVHMLDTLTGQDPEL
jgi:ribose 5-phosphate isomerase B